MTVGYTRLLIFLAPLALALAPPLARADEILHASGTTSTGLPLSATVDFQFKQGQLVFTLTNTLSPSQIRSTAQAISDISFTLSNAPGTLTTTTASGQLGDVSATGRVDYRPGTPDRWLPGDGGTFDITGNTVTMSVIGGGTPSEMILPFVTDGSKYTNANTGFPHFNPYVIGPGTFTLDLAGISPSTTVTSATISFGTGPETFLVAVPEPSTLALMAFGFGAIGLAGWRLRSRWKPTAT